MTVREAKARLNDFDDDELDVYVLIEGNDDDFPVHDIKAGELKTKTKTQQKTLFL